MLRVFRYNTRSITGLEKKKIPQALSILKMAPRLGTEQTCRLSYMNAMNSTVAGTTSR